VTAESLVPDISMHVTGKRCQVCSSRHTMNNSNENNDCIIMCKNLCS